MRRIARAKLSAWISRRASALVSARVATQESLTGPGTASSSASSPAAARSSSSCLATVDNAVVVPIVVLTAQPRGPPLATKQLRLDALVRVSRVDGRNGDSFRSPDQQRAAI